MLNKSEYERLLDGEKPMAAYYRAVGEEYYYDDRDNFSSATIETRLTRHRFFVENQGQAFRMAYETYANPENVWRLKVYQLLKKIGQDIWNADLEEIEGILLGYRGMYGNAVYENPMQINETP